MAIPINLTVLVRPTEYSASYSTEQMFDHTPSSYWCSPASPQYPYFMAFQLGVPAMVEAFVIDTRVSGYETSAPRDIVVELQHPTTPGVFQPVCGGMVMAGQVCTVPLPQPSLATAVRIVIRSNHGGNYLAISTLAVLGTPAGLPQPTAYPAAGGYPQQAGYPAQPQGYPAQPAGYPQQTGYPAQPAYGQPAAYPQAGYPAQAGYGQPAGYPQSTGAYPPGTRVSAQWGAGGSWWPGTITQWNGSQYEVQWESGGQREWVAANMVRPA